MDVHATSDCASAWLIRCTARASSGRAERAASPTESESESESHAGA